MKQWFMLLVAIVAVAAGMAVTFNDSQQIPDH